MGNITILYFFLGKSLSFSITWLFTVANHKQHHSYAAMLLENEVDMKTIQEQLGDATLKFVSDTYTHVAEKLKKKAADKLSGF